MTEERAVDATVAAQELLEAWLHMSLTIRANRVLNDLTFNQMAVCNILKQEAAKGHTGLSAAELCSRTRLLKSQMNKELSGLEKKGLISKAPDKADGRKIIVSLADDQAAYDQEHARIMELFSALTAHLGSQRTYELALSLKAATDAAEQYLQGEQKGCPYE